MLIALIKTMRPQQWTKNLFAFVPIFFDEKLFNLVALGNTSLGFFLLCMISGVVYIINDLVDIEKDRAHPRKKKRPLASGALSKNFARGGIAVLLVLILPLSFILNIRFGIIILTYLVLQIAYSFILKNIVIIDVMAIAAGFVLRVAAGVSLIEVTRFSPWLYLFTTMLALFMGFGKRRQEVILMQNGHKNTRSILNQYSIPFIDEILSVVIASIILTYAFYTFTAPNLPQNNTMMLTIPFVIYAVFRYLYLLHMKDSSGDPSEIALHDRPIQIAVLLFGLLTLILIY